MVIVGISKLGYSHPFKAQVDAMELLGASGFPILGAFGFPTQYSYGRRSHTELR